MKRKCGKQELKYSGEGDKYRRRYGWTKKADGGVRKSQTIRWLTMHLQVPTVLGG